MKKSLRNPDLNCNQLKQYKSETISTLKIVKNGKRAEMMLKILSLLIY